jgi:hypothetical protein
MSEEKRRNNLALGRVGKGLAYATGEAAKHLALPAAFLSMANEGGYVERGFGGYLDTLYVAKEVAEDVIMNEGIRTFGVDAGLGIFIAAGNMADNLKADAETTLGVALGTFSLGKGIPYI